MSKIKPNKLAECQKQASGFDVEIPSEINEHEKGYYHLAYVEKVHRADLQRYDERVTIIKINQTDYITKIDSKSTKGSDANTMALLGYKDLFILHDPTVRVAPKKKAAPKKTEPKTEE